MQAKAAPGNVFADAKYIDGTQHTLSVWKDRQSMLRYMRTGDHVKAMKIFDDIATGKVYGYETDDETAPTWEEARKLYDTNGRLVGKAGREAKKRAQRENDAIVNNDKVPGVSIQYIAEVWMSHLCFDICVVWVVFILLSLTEAALKYYLDPRIWKKLEEATVHERQSNARTQAKSLKKQSTMNKGV